MFSSDRASRGDLYRVRVADGHTDRLTTNFVGRAIMPAVSPDGSKVAFAAQTLRLGEFWVFQVHMLDLASGRTEPLPASGGACWPSWSPDGRALYNVQLDREPSFIQRRDLASGALSLGARQSVAVELLPPRLTGRAVAGGVAEPGSITRARTGIWRWSPRPTRDAGSRSRPARATIASLTGLARG